MTTKVVDKKPSQEEKFWAAASYLWIISLVALAARNKNEFIRFHANQGVMLFLLSLILMFIPIIGWLLNVLLAVVMIVGIIKAMSGERWPLPFVAEPSVKLGDWIIKSLKL